MQGMIKAVNRQNKVDCACTARRDAVTTHAHDQTAIIMHKGLPRREHVILANAPRLRIALLAR